MMQVTFKLTPQQRIISPLAKAGKPRGAVETKTGRSKRMEED